MFVVSLIGNHRDTVINLPFTAAQNSLANGTVRVASQEEIDAAGFPVPDDLPAAPQRAMPVGYTERWDPGWGYDVVFSGFDQPLNTGALPNRLAAIDFAYAHEQSVEDEITAETSDRSLVEIPSNWQDLNAADMRDLAAKFSNDPVRTKADGIAIIQAELDRRDDQAAKALPATDAPADPITGV